MARAEQNHRWINLLSLQRATWLPAPCWLCGDAGKQARTFPQELCLTGAREHRLAKRESSWNECSVFRGAPRVLGIRAGA